MMTPTRIDKSISRKRLQLTFWEKYDHYSFGRGLSYPLAIMILFMIYEGHFEVFLFVVGFIFFVPGALILFYVGRKRLVLRKSSKEFISDEKAYEAVIAAVKRLNWSILYENKKNYIQACRKRKSFFERSNEIRIFIRDGTVYSTSLYYPVMQAGLIEDRNLRNVFIFNKELQNIA